MFYTNKVLFIHVPRTGGTWLTRWAVDHLCASCDVHFLKHLSHRSLIEAVPGLKSLVPFSIVRDRGERVRSAYELHVNEEPSALATYEWLQVVDAVKKMTFEEFEASRHNVADLEYWGDDAHPVLFQYQNPLTDVVEWLVEIHGI